MSGLALSGYYSRQILHTTVSGLDTVTTTLSTSSMGPLGVVGRKGSLILHTPRRLPFDILITSSAERERKEGEEGGEFMISTNLSHRGEVNRNRNSGNLLQQSLENPQARQQR